MKYKYVIFRKDDGYHIMSNEIEITNTGVWIFDELETGDNCVKIFIPMQNIKQIIEYI